MAQRNGEAFLDDSRKTDKWGFAPYHVRLAVESEDVNALLGLKLEQVAQLRAVREELCQEAYDLLIGVSYGASPEAPVPSVPRDFEALKEDDRWRAAFWGALQHAWRAEQHLGGDHYEPAFAARDDEQEPGNLKRKAGPEAAKSRKKKK